MPMTRYLWTTAVLIGIILSAMALLSWWMPALLPIIER